MFDRLLSERLAAKVRSRLFPPTSSLLVLHLNLHDSFLSSFSLYLSLCTLLPLACLLEFSSVECFSCPHASWVFLSFFRSVHLSLASLFLYLVCASLSTRFPFSSCHLSFSFVVVSRVLRFLFLLVDQNDTDGKAIAFCFSFSSPVSTGISCLTEEGGGEKVESQTDRQTSSAVFSVALLFVLSADVQGTEQVEEGGSDCHRSAHVREGDRSLEANLRQPRCRQQWNALRTRKYTRQIQRR